MDVDFDALGRLMQPNCRVTLKDAASSAAADDDDRMAQL